MNVRHYFMGVGLWIESKWKRIKFRSKMKFRRAKDADVEKKVLYVGSALVFLAQSISAIVFLYSFFRKPFKKKNHHG